MKREWSLEPDLHWTEHYVKYGFTVLEDMLEPDFIDASLAEVRRLCGSDLPFEEWTKDNVVVPRASDNEIFVQVYEQPRLRAALEEMFAPNGSLCDEHCFQLFVTPYNPQAQRQLAARGHIDFVNKPIPITGRGFVFQAALLDREPFGGSITIWPETHKWVQKAVMDDPQWRYPVNWDDIPKGEPFEFVAEAGDVLSFHHLVAHSSNPNCTRLPRINLHCQAWQEEWPEEINAEDDLSPWQRSLTLNGTVTIGADEQEMREMDRQGKVLA